MPFRPERPAHAKVGGPPKRWTRLVVLDAVTREEIPHVTEASAAEGWIRQVRRGPDGRIVRGADGPVVDRIKRPIVICDRRADPDARDPSKPLRPPFDHSPSPGHPTPPVAPPRTPEDGRRPSTPEDGQPVTTR